MKKKLFGMLLCVLVLQLSAPITSFADSSDSLTITTTSAYGATASGENVEESPLELSTYEISFYDWESSTGSSDLEVLSGKVQDVISSNEEVATAYLRGDYGDKLGYIFISPHNRGETEITVIGKNGDTVTIKVSVDFSFDFNKEELIIDCTYNYYWEDPNVIKLR